MCEIGKKMYMRRKELGLTLEEVGDAVGVGKSTVRRWENGMIKNMGRDKIAALARVLRMSPVEFVPGDDIDKAALMGHSSYTFTQTNYQSTNEDELLAVMDSIK